MREPAFGVARRLPCTPLTSRPPCGAARRPTHTAAPRATRRAQASPRAVVPVVPARALTQLVGCSERGEQRIELEVAFAQGSLAPTVGSVATHARPSAGYARHQRPADRGLASTAFPER
jgi:hypothetical protein